MEEREIHQLGAEASEHRVVETSWEEDLLVVAVLEEVGRHEVRGHRMDDPEEGPCQDEEDA